MEPFRNSQVTLALSFIVFLACFLVATPALELNKKTTPVINFIWVHNCSGDKSSPFSYMKEVKITKRGLDTFVLNMDIIVNRPYSKPNTQVEMFKCSDRDGKKCEFVMNVPISTCILFEAKNQFWTPIVESIHPPFNCTHVSNGVYKMIDGTIDTSKTMEMAKMLINGDLFGYYWKCRVSLSSKKKNDFCGEFLLKMNQIKS